MIARFLIISLSGIGLGILQSTLLGQIIPFDFIPDIALLLLIAASWRYGSMMGQISGFLIGLSLDALSLAPLGFHAFLYTVVGYLYGRLQDNIAPGPVFFPVLAAIAGTIIKYGGSFLLALIFGLNAVAARNFSLGTLWETLANMVLAPIVFLLVTLTARAFEGRRGGFQ